ncbi:MAG: zinc-binding dehydrogenase [Lachnospiraceae bacterium]|nr:zinc-binding dehydrogenase [Lachnospiraceae bacterium]
MNKKMKAVVLTQPTKGEDIVISETPIPEVKPGWVLVKVKAFGMNHSEQILREFEIQNSYIQKPIIPGIECVGEIADSSDSGLKKGQKVAALMGGMGRSFNGSYAEYALLPVHHVFPVESKLSWSEMAAIPETYFTAWGSLIQCLNVTKDDILLVRGATCALGYVAIQIAKAIGCKVIGTTHRESKMKLLEKAGCDEIILDDGSLRGKIDIDDGSLRGKSNSQKKDIGTKLNSNLSDLQGNPKTTDTHINVNEMVNKNIVTKALELIGIKTVKDTMSIMKQGGIVCNTGVLGKVYEWNHFDPIKDIPNGVCLTGFYSNYPTQRMLQDIFDFMDEHELKPLIGATFEFEKIREACMALDSGSINGKIVVKAGE